MKNQHSRVVKFPRNTKNVKQDLDLMAERICTNLDVPSIQYLIDRVVQITNEKTIGDWDGK